MNWKPMDSAPKDRRILLEWLDGDFWEIEFGQWESEQFYRKPKAHWQGEGRYWRGIRFYRERSPVAWMEVPEPPTPTVKP